ncbi:hypothetical protein [Marinilabilia rubra]|uniref:Uncharacterized protein n=1 Tax=Marinilabilia rubra TaxID=2162893 RepID=A0A2U2B9H6_9BACT|nr:hypothetical protein [Marinilabilia rubra]PWD99702.1 hypothetical protein DDZ16_09670 [Marinilabilia rubra]
MKIADVLKTVLPAAVILFAGCQDDDIVVNTDNTDDNREIEIAAPAGEITYEIADLLADLDNEYVFVDEQGLVNVSYDQTVDIEWETLVSIPDVSESWSFSPTEGIPFPSSQLKAAANVSFTEKVRLNNRDDVRYDSLNMDNGLLVAQLRFPPGTTGTASVTIPEVTDNGTPLTYTFDVTETTYVFDINEDLSGMQVEPSQAPDSSYLSVITAMDLTNVAVGDVALDFQLTNMQPGMTFGYFGNQTSPVRSEELVFDVFDDLELLEEQSIEFGNVFLNLEVNSGIGVPFNVRVENMNFYMEDGTPYSEPLTVDGNPFIDMTLEAATYANPVEPTTTSLRINKETPSNIVDIVNSYPRRMEFDVFSESNPTQDPQTFNFMGPDNVLNGTMNVVLPAYFKTSAYNRTDTVDFDFNDMVGEDDEDVRELQEFTVYFDFFSKIPVDISAGAYVIDGNGNKIDDLLEASTSVIAAGVPDGETGKVTEAKQTTFTITVSGDQIDQFLDQNAMNIVIETDFNTGGDDYIRIYEDMDFRAVVSFEGTGKIPSF